MIEPLPRLTPGAHRSQRTNARCHERLARRRERLASGARGTSTKYLMVERAVIGGLCVIYISAVALVALRMLAGG